MIIVEVVGDCINQVMMFWRGSLAERRSSLLRPNTMRWTVREQVAFFFMEMEIVFSKAFCPWTICCLCAMKSKRVNYILLETMFLDESHHKSIFIHRELWMCRCCFLCAMLRWQRLQRGVVSSLVLINHIAIVFESRRSESKFPSIAPLTTWSYFNTKL